jgi:16S rRNA (adenine1518-N6/adenine1519-N6)-dimethyltransferase
MFLHRRKFLRSQLISAMQELMTKEQVDAVLDQLGLEPNLRAEQLTVQQMISLLESCRTRCSA